MLLKDEKMAILARFTDEELRRVFSLHVALANLSNLHDPQGILSSSDLLLLHLEERERRQQRDLALDELR